MKASHVLCLLIFFLASFQVLYYLEISHFSAMIEILVRSKPSCLGLNKRDVEGRSLFYAW